MDRLFWGVIKRQIPILVASVITGTILAYYIGFWLGLIINTVAWGTLVFLAKFLAAKAGINSDPFHDDRYLMNFAMALVGRNK